MHFYKNQSLVVSFHWSAPREFRRFYFHHRAIVSRLFPVSFRWIVSASIAVKVKRFCWGHLEGLSSLDWFHCPFASVRFRLNGWFGLLPERIRRRFSTHSNDCIRVMLGFVSTGGFSYPFDAARWLQRPSKWVLDGWGGVTGSSWREDKPLKGQRRMGRGEEEVDENRKGRRSEEEEEEGEEGKDLCGGAELSWNSSDADGNSSLFFRYKRKTAPHTLYFCPFQAHAYNVWLPPSRLLVVRVATDFVICSRRNLSREFQDSFVRGCWTGDSFPFSFLFFYAMQPTGNVEPPSKEDWWTRDLRPRPSPGSLTWIIHRLVCRLFFSTPPRVRWFPLVCQVPFLNRTTTVQDTQQENGDSVSMISVLFRTPSCLVI